MKKRNNKAPRIVISGYYGYGSIGDEAVLFSILSGIAKHLPESRVSVLTKRRNSLPKIKGISVTPCPRLDPFSLVHALINADVFVSGGGSLLQDKTSKRSLLYYCTLIRLAKLCRTRVYVYANGIGPVTDTKICSKVLGLCDRISVRDPDSYATAKAMTKKQGDILITADPLFAYPFSKKRSNPSPAVVPTPYFTVSLRRCADNESIDIDALCSAVSHFKGRGYLPVFVSMQDSYDLELCKTAAKKTGGTVADVSNADGLFFLMEKASFALGMRLHFLLTAAAAGTPLVALSYDCKVDSCMKYLDVGEVLNAFDLSSEEIIHAVESSKKAHKRQDTEYRCKIMKELAEKDFIFLRELFATRMLDRQNNTSPEKFFADT